MESVRVLEALLELEERWLDSSPSLEQRAAAYAQTAARVRRRPPPAQMIYRYPRGRRTDAVPLATALGAGDEPPTLRI